MTVVRCLARPMLAATFVKGGLDSLRHPAVRAEAAAPVIHALAEPLRLPDDPELLVRGEEVVPGSETEYYDRVHLLDYWVQDGILRSSRSVSSYARGNMMRLSPRAYVADAWTWTLDDDGVLRHGDPACVMQSYDSARKCGLDPVDTVASLPVERASYVGIGETVDLTDETGYGFTASIEAESDPSLVVDKVVLAEGVKGHGIGEIIGLARDRGVPVERASADRVKKLAGNGRQDQGVFADVVAPRMRPLTDALDDVTLRRVLLLDGITTPANVGMILRSATAAGIDGASCRGAGSPPSTRWWSRRRPAWRSERPSSRSAPRARLPTCSPRPGSTWSA